MEKIKILVDGMHCIKCEGKVERAVALAFARQRGISPDQAVSDDHVLLDPQVFTVRASSQFGSVRVICNDAEHFRPCANEAISQAGFVVLDA